MKTVMTVSPKLVEMACHCYNKGKFMESKLVEKLLHYLDGIESFANKQLPDFADQFIKYETWNCEWSFKIALCLMILFFILVLISFVATIIKDGDDGIPCCWMTIIVGIAFVVSIFCSIGEYKDLKQLQMAPKVYMVKRAKALVAPPCGK